MGRLGLLRIQWMEVTFHDMAKAVDDLSHSLVFAGMRRLGYHEIMIRFVKGLYEGCTTIFSS